MSPRTSPLTRAVFALVCMTAVLTACSKPMSPVAGRPASGSTDETALGWASARTHEPQVARARLRFIATVVEQDADFGTRLQRNVEYLVDAPQQSPPASIDSVPVHSILKQVRWRVPGPGGDHYFVDNHPEYDVDTPEFAPPTDAGLPPGVLGFRLRVPEPAGGGWIQVWVQSNLAPEFWWAGPDPSRFPASSDGDGRAVDVTDWHAFATSPAWPPDGRGYFGPDSFQFVPHRRLPVNNDLDRRTFYEIWGDRIYARSEGDVVHLGAWVVFSLGGFDADSPYKVTVSPGAATVPPGYESQPELYALLIEQGLIGSPVGFRQRVQTRLASGQVTQPSETTTTPNFDAFSVFYSPAVALYWKVTFPGKAYATGFPVDGNGLVGRTTEDLVALADRVDAGLGSAADQVLRRRVLTFYVSEPSPLARSGGGQAGGH